MRLLSIIVSVGAAALVAAHAANDAPAATDASVQVKVQICGQIKNGPFNDWSMPRSAARQLGLPARLRGRTWTVLARGTSCSFALKSSRKVLRQWAKTEPGRLLIRDHGVRGYFCSKNRPPRGGRGHSGALCLYLAIGRGFAFYQLGSLTLAQIKRFAAAGRLPG